MGFSFRLINHKKIISFKIFLVISLLHVVKSELTCLGCLPNFYFDQELEVCRKCPNNTLTLEMNASMVDECVCTKGFENKTLEKCSECEVGFYQDTNGNFSCIQCSSNSLTIAVASTSESECRCEPGFTPSVLEAPTFVDNADNVDYATCAPCEAGKFKPTLSDVVCSDCPVNFYCPEQSVNPLKCVPNSTSTSNSQNVEDCHCNAGFHYVSTDGVQDYHCDLCEPGSFTDTKNKNSCTLCPAGFWSDLYGTTQCFACPLDSYCPEGSVLPIACPGNSVSVQYSSVIADCHCNPGYHFSLESTDTLEQVTYGCVACAPGFYNELYNQEFCIECPVNTFNTHHASSSSSDCLACTANSSSVASSDEVQDCLCDLGFSGSPGEECIECGPGFFRSNHSEYICTSCPSDTYNVDYASDSDEHCAACDSDKVSGSGSGAKFQCVCKAGLFRTLHESGNEWTCTPCPVGSFSTNINTLQCSLCPSGKFSNATSATSSETCTVCADGTFTLLPGSSECSECEPGMWQDVKLDEYQQKVCSLCPLNSTQNNFGSFDVNDCTCDAHFEKKCTQFDSELSEVCIAFECVPCGADHFCAGSNAKEACPANSIAPTSSSVVTDCVCNVSYYGSDGGPCLACEENFYCPGGENQVSCMSFSSSDILSSRIEDCVCNPSYYSTAPGQSCQKCPPGYYCGGGTHRSQCANNSDSRSGSNTINACLCDPGYWRGCILTEDGTYVNGDNVVCDTNWDIPCMLCEENNVCVNNSLLHCPHDSSAPIGTHDAHACVCNNGYYKVHDDGEFVSFSWANSEQVMEMTMTLDVTLAEFDSQMQEDYKDSIAEASGVGSDSVQILSITEVQTRRRLLSSGIEVKTGITGIKTIVEDLVLEHEKLLGDIKKKMKSKGLNFNAVYKTAPSLEQPPVEPAATIGIPGPITDGNPLTMTYRKSSTGPASADGFKGYLGNKILIGSDVVPIGTPATYDDYEINTGTVNLAQDIAGRVAVYDWANGAPAGGGQGGGAWGSNCGFTFLAYVAQKAGATGLLLLGNPKDGLSTDLKLQCNNQALLDAVSIPTFHGKIFDNGNQVYATNQGSRVQERMTAAGPDNLAFEVTDATTELTDTGGQASIGETVVPPSEEVLEVCTTDDRQVSCEGADKYNSHGGHYDSCWKCYMEDEASRCAECNDALIAELQAACDGGHSGACDDVAIYIQCRDCTKKYYNVPNGDGTYGSPCKTCSLPTYDGRSLYVYADHETTVTTYDNHPFKITLVNKHPHITAEGEDLPGQLWNDYTNTIAPVTTFTIDVQYECQILWYWCENHAGMTGGLLFVMPYDGSACPQTHF